MNFDTRLLWKTEKDLKLLMVIVFNYWRLLQILKKVSQKPKKYKTNVLPEILLRKEHFADNDSKSWHCICILAPHSKWSTSWFSKLLLFIMWHCHLVRFLANCTWNKHISSMCAALQRKGNKLQSPAGSAWHYILTLSSESTFSILHVQCRVAVPDMRMCTENR